MGFRGFLTFSNENDNSHFIAGKTIAPDEFSADNREDCPPVKPVAPCEHPVVTMRVPILLPKVKGVKLVTRDLYLPQVASTFSEYHPIAEAWLRAIVNFKKMTKHSIPRNFEAFLPIFPSFRILDSLLLSTTFEIEPDSTVRLQIMKTITLRRLNDERKVTKAENEKLQQSAQTQNIIYQTPARSSSFLSPPPQMAHPTTHSLLLPSMLIQKRRTVNPCVCSNFCSLPLIPIP